MAKIYSFTLLCCALVSSLYYSYTVTQERNYLKAELYATLGVAEKATIVAENATEIAIKYQTEIAELKDEQARLRIASYIHHINNKVDSDRISVAIIAASKIHDIDPYLIASKLKVESDFRPKVVSVTGCRGIAQMCMAAAKEMGISWEETFDIEKSIIAGAGYLKKQMVAYNGNVYSALMRYNGWSDPAYAIKVSNAYNRVKAWKV